ncbi:polysaccharide deacetylase family protein [Cognatishimia maritima]|uniref:Polysaccharide deacetylase n=1 Tax=Cognatishimia maritima TaxID=870908 RepID=A0A1M5MZ87_9RHOB|nr:polysaccharide deacetylase family protein [Cognatishimia maritima]SHG82588.1 hypothetical protein SAMN04488044_1378 [Cognatishimia maritima]
MQPDWAPLRAELKKWHRKDLVLPVWWRDDDAIDLSENLDRLIALSDSVGVPVHLAVIPRNATQALADCIQETPYLIPVVHGWAHRNHQPAEDTKCEFGENRPIGDRREEAAEGLRRLERLLGDRVAPMFVPPWNRVPKAFHPVLAEIGYRALSTCFPRDQVEAAPGLTQINTHIDPLYWRPARLLSDPDLIVDRIVDLLKRRRQGKADNAEPFGLLTHHLVHDDRVWEFCRQYWRELLEGPVSLYRADVP